MICGPEEVTNDEGTLRVGGGLDPAYSLPGKIRQPRFELPMGTDWKGLKRKAEIEVKGVGYPVRWACQQALEEDGSLRNLARDDIRAPWDSGVLCACEQRSSSSRCSLATCHPHMTG